MKLSEYQRSRSFFDLDKGHSDFKVILFDFGRYTQVSDSGPRGPLVLIAVSSALQKYTWTSYCIENMGSYTCYSDIFYREKKHLCGFRFAFLRDRKVSK